MGKSVCNKVKMKKIARVGVYISCPSCARCRIKLQMLVLCET